LSKWERLGELACYPDPWLRSCAIFEIGQLGATELVEPVVAALHSDHMLVSETALAACRSLLETGRLNHILKEQAAQQQFPQLRRYAQALLQRA
jgi:hypothetical protein